MLILSTIVKKMNKIKLTIVVFAVIMLGLLQNINSQHNIITISGKNYIIHIVKKGETLFNISKQYNTVLDSLLSANPGITPSTVKVGEALKIPIYEPAQNQTDTIFHNVKKGETIYSISRIYGVKPKEITNINPNAENGLSIDQQLVIVIPSEKGSKKQTIPKTETKTEIVTEVKTEIQTVKSSTPENQKFLYHTVQPKETLYGISRLYEVNIETIRENNPELKEQAELQINTTLKIPNINYKPTTTEPNETTTFPTISTKQSLCNPAPINSVLNIALMLPFYTQSFSTDTVTATRREQIPARSRQFIDFYQGALLAMEDLKNSGLQAHLYVYDTQGEPIITENICNYKEFNTFDLIIGPVFGRNLEIVAQYAKEKNIPLVSPLSTEDKFIQNFENSFMISPSARIQEIEFKKAVKRINKGDYLIIYDNNQYDTLFLAELKKDIHSLYNYNNISDLKYKELAWKKGSDKSFYNLFTNKDSMVVVLLSDDKAFVSDIVGRLNTLTEQCYITLFGQPRWSKFDNIKLEFFHNLNTHIFALSFIDYQKENVVNFVKRYRQTYFTEPPARAFEGYDITFYFVNALKTYGKNFRHCFENYHPELLNMQFDFQQNKSGNGFINNHIYLINYNRNWEMQVVRNSE